MLWGILVLNHMCALHLIELMKLLGRRFTYLICFNCFQYLYSAKKGIDKCVLFDLYADKTRKVNFLLALLETFVYTMSLIPLQGNEFGRFGRYTAASNSP